MVGQYFRFCDNSLGLVTLLPTCAGADQDWDWTRLAPDTLRHAHQS